MTTTDTTPEPTETIDEFVGRFATDLGAVLHAATVVIGDKLGLYKELAALGPATPAELARAADCDERSVHEWLNAQAASGDCYLLHLGP